MSSHCAHWRAACHTRPVRFALPPVAPAVARLGPCGASLHPAQYLSWFGVRWRGRTALVTVRRVQSRWVAPVCSAQTLGVQPCAV